MDSGVNAAARLDRLPMGSFHWRVLRLVGLGMFFDSFDTSMMAGVLAALTSAGWSNLAMNARFVSATFLGVATGAALAGLMGDRFGRRFAYQFNLAIFGIMALVAACAPSMPWLIAFRGVMGIGLGAEFVVGYGIVAEFVPPQRRGWALAMLNLISSSGVFVVSLLGLVVIPRLGWRAMFVIGGVGALVVWYLRRSLPESPRWLEAMGRTDDAERIVRQIEQEAAKGNPLPPVAQPERTPSRPPSIAVLFSRPVIGRTAMAIAVNVVCLVGAYSFTAWIPTFFVKQGLSVTRSLGFSTAMTAGTIVGPLIGVLISDRIGRKHGIALSGLACAVVGAIYPFLTTPLAIVACGFLLISSMSLFLSLGLGAYTPELFPTEYRFRGAGVGQMAGRAGLIAAPFAVIALFNAYGVGGVVSAIAMMYLSLSIVIALVGIDTNQRPLEALAPVVSRAASPGRGVPAVGGRTSAPHPVVRAGEMETGQLSRSNPNG